MKASQHQVEWLWRRGGMGLHVRQSCGKANVQWLVVSTGLSAFFGRHGCLYTLQQCDVLSMGWINGIRNEENRAKLYTKGRYALLVICSTAHFAANAFSFSLSLVEKSVTFILKDAFKRKEENWNLYFLYWY